MLLSFRALSTGLSGESQWAGLPHDNASYQSLGQADARASHCTHGPSRLPLSPIGSGCEDSGDRLDTHNRTSVIQFEKLYCLSTHYSHLQLKSKCGLIPLWKLYRNNGCSDLEGVFHTRKVFIQTLAYQIIKWRCKSVDEVVQVPPCMTLENWLLKIWWAEKTYWCNLISA